MTKSFMHLMIMNALINSLHDLQNYRAVKTFGFGIENIGELSLYTKGNQDKIKSWRLKLWQIDQQSPNAP